MAEDLDSNDPEVRLSQFLYVGKEYPDYQPGNWFVHNYFLTKNVPSIEELAGNSQKRLLPVDIINKAFESNLVPNPETLVFALAVCCRQTKTNILREEAYLAVDRICVSPQHFILFIKFASEIRANDEQEEIEQISEQEEIEQMSEQKEIEQIRNGWGHGLRKTVSNWYSSKSAMELAKCVTRYKSRYGWKHKDIIKMCHPAPKNPDTQLVFKYVVRGLGKIQESSIEDPVLLDILKYIKRVEDFKHCTNEVEAADLLEVNRLTLDHVPGHLLKSKEIWTALIPSMNLVMLLTNLQRIHNLKLLKPGSPIVSKIIKQITNKENIARDKVHPVLIFVTIKTYENSGKILKYEKMKLFNKPLLTPPEPNFKIIDALYKMWNISFFHVQSTDLRYMITISMNKAMLETHIWRNSNINGAEAGCMIALALLRSEKNVTVATFKNGGVHIEEIIEKNVTFNQLMKKLQEMPVGTINLGKPMSWAGNKNYKYDVFINIVDQIFEKFDTSEEALQAYNTKLKLKNTKLINCAVCSSSTYRKQKSNKNILTMNGFDASTPVVIQAFVKSLF
ncbi:60 kDa SS-A/Ro ribonucleoprotein [Melipona quadrifasciata]|uniref:60 kDa SS-A/Ro ribonucleoprotein n=1 Tax=Melipona quadrifasciata TaxID=166423 RepID=A0A0N0BJR8_9HYME|nr:60 kDa SS-A/Ro ribonucleoprotein [Melipona quadrifasciata]